MEIIEWGLAIAGLALILLGFRNMVRQEISSMVRAEALKGKP